MKKIKTISLILALYSFFIMSCNDNPVNPVDSNYIAVSGIIQNWHYGTNYKVVAYAELPDKVLALDSCFVDVFSIFSLKLPIPPDSMLGNFNLFDTSFCSGYINLNPDNSKCTGIFFEVYYGKESIGHIELRSDSTYNSLVTVINTYFNCEGNLIAWDSCNYNGDIRTESYNINFKKGLNYWYIKYFDNKSGNINLSYTSTQPMVVKWYFMPNIYLIKKELKNKIFITQHIIQILLDTL